MAQRPVSLPKKGYISCWGVRAASCTHRNPNSPTAQTQRRSPQFVVRVHIRIRRVLACAAERALQVSFPECSRALSARSRNEVATVIVYAMESKYNNVLLLHLLTMASTSACFCFCKECAPQDTDITDSVCAPSKHTVSEMLEIRRTAASS